MAKTISADYECTPRCALIDMTESNPFLKEQRIWLLMEIADEAQCLKLSGEDKIRVVAQAAAFLKAQHKT